MLASKENARKAAKAFGRLESYLASTDFPINDWHTVHQFIEAAIKRLPCEASFKRDRERRRAKAAAK